MGHRMLAQALRRSVAHFPIQAARLLYDLIEERYGVRL